MIGEAMMIAWSRLGLRIEKTIELPESLTIYITVPEFSFNIVNDEQMAGMTLAKRFKDALIEMGVKRLSVKVKIRTGENWTQSMASAEEENMMRVLYGSQY